MELRIVSGGQTGVDRAALDVALALGLPCGGWCPRGRLAEDGPLSARYPLEETSSSRYPVRTAWNVRDADATLVLTRGEPTGGTALTVEEAARRRRPHLVLDLGGDPGSAVVREWVARVGARVLNVAGPRESTCPGIQREAAAFLRRVLQDWARPARDPTGPDPVQPRLPFPGESPGKDPDPGEEPEEQP